MSGTRVSGVGSIPTRSRQTCRRALGPVGLGALLLCGVIGFGAGSARAQDAPPASADTLGAPAETPAPRAVQREATPWTRRPTAIMFRSVLFPGWGQWTNGRHLKAAIVFGAEGYLIYRATRAGLRERDARDAARREPALEGFWLAEAERHNAERRDYTWWTVFALIMSMGDAYVDAVLGDFDAELEPEPGALELRVGYRYQWD